MSERKKILLLGCSGSIGTQTLDVIASHRDKLQVTGLVTHSRMERLNSQAIFFDVPTERRLTTGNLRNSKEAKAHIEQLIASDETEIVVNAMSGAAGLRASLQTLQHDKILALANKESLVVGGDLIMPLARQRQVEHGGAPEDIRLRPIDSEHGAIFQCIVGEQHAEMSNLWITASGGPFRHADDDELQKVTAADALKHPTWNMGPKITIDSATLMNKGLEVIEAHHLFDLPYDQIKVVVQPQSAIHSMVEFIDGSVKAHLGPTDMRIPIQYALSFPQRWDVPAQIQPMDFTKLGTLEFEAPDMQKFPCLAMAFKAGQHGGLAPCVMNAANEVVVAAFLADKIKFPAIAEITAKVLEEFLSQNNAEDAVESLEQLVATDSWARNRAAALL